MHEIPLTCASCGSPISHEEEENVPNVEDHEEWKRLADMHTYGCDWIESRAHRYGVLKGIPIHVPRKSPRKMGD